MPENSLLQTCFNKKKMFSFNEQGKTIFLQSSDGFDFVKFSFSQKDFLIKQQVTSS